MQTGSQTDMSIDRRSFIAQTSAGLAALLVAPGQWRIQTPARKKRQYEFRPYRAGETLGPVMQVTPRDGFYVNTYYDVQPWSPSGRYIAVTRLPYQDQVTVLGDEAEACVIDLQEQTIETLYTTRSWGYQLGASLRWGESDRYLYTNDVVTSGEPGERTRTVCVRIDRQTGETTAFGGPMYDIDPTRETAVGPRAELLNVTQYAYSTPARSKESIETLPPGAASGEGIWQSRPGSEKQLLVSLEEAAGALPSRDYYDGGTLYFFHTKYNPQGERLLLVLRGIFPDSVDGKGGNNPVLLSSSRDGGDLRVAVSRELWARGGHHPTWHPDGQRVLMNLTPPGEDTMRFCLIEPDGSNLEVLTEAFTGSGHPTVTPDTRHLLTDAYPFEPAATEDGEVPIRLIDLEEGEERTVCTIFTDVFSGREDYGSFRSWGPGKLDAHPSWNRDYSKVCFNGAPDGRRQVFITDLSDVLA